MYRKVKILYWKTFTVGNWAWLRIGASTLVLVGKQIELYLCNAKDIQLELWFMSSMLPRFLILKPNAQKYEIN